MLFADAQAEVQIEPVVILIGAIFAGAVCGIWPLTAGAKKGRPGLGVIGFFACLGSGFVLGCLLALPMAIFFRLLIGALDHPPPPGGYGLDDDRFDDPYERRQRSAY